MSFSVPFNQFVLNAKADLTKKTRAKTFALFEKIVMRTPVYTGRARANWNVSVGAPDFSVTNQTNLSRALTEIAKVNTLPVGSVLYLSNGLPYIRLLEFGGYPNPPKNPTGRTVAGFSSQAPAGMVRLSVLEFRGTIEGANK